MLFTVNLVKFTVKCTTLVTVWCATVVLFTSLVNYDGVACLFLFCTSPPFLLGVHCNMCDEWLLVKLIVLHNIAHKSASPHSGVKVK